MVSEERRVAEVRAQEHRGSGARGGRDFSNLRFVGNFGRYEDVGDENGAEVSQCRFYDHLQPHSWRYQLLSLPVILGLKNACPPSEMAYAAYARPWLTAMV